MRADSSVDGLAKLRPAFDPEGSVTAGNASQISDGAAALVVASSDAAEELGVKPLAKIVGHGTVGVSPEAIFTAPAAGVAALLERHVLQLAERNETRVRYVAAVDLPDPEGGHPQPALAT